MLSKKAYLQELLHRYQANFDITENYELGEKTYDAYAWFYSFSEKYVLKKEAQLWAIKAFEHVLFKDTIEISKETLTDLRNEIETCIEPNLVRKNNRYPEKDHMCSYITLVLMTDNDPDELTKKAIKKFSFDKGYLFNFRGHCEVRLCVVSMNTGNVFTNKMGKELKRLLEDVFSKVEKIAS